MRTVPSVLVLDATDNVAVCLAEIPAGTEVSLPDGREPVVAKDRIPAGHKVAIERVAEGAPVRKYGQPIGVALRPIRRGEHVHVHNVASGRAGGNKP